MQCSCVMIVINETIQDVQFDRRYLTRVFLNSDGIIFLLFDQHVFVKIQTYVLRILTGKKNLKFKLQRL